MKVSTGNTVGFNPTNKQNPWIKFGAAVEKEIANNPLFK